MVLNSINQVSDQITRFGYKYARLFNNDNAVALFNCKTATDLQAELSDFLREYPNRYKIDFKPAATAGNQLYTITYAPGAEMMQGNQPQPDVNRDEIKREIMAELEVKQREAEAAAEVAELREALEQKSQLQGVLNSALEHILTKLMRNPAIQGLISGQKANLNGETTPTEIDNLTDDQYSQVIQGVNLMLSTPGVNAELIEHLGNYINQNPAQVAVLKQITNYGS